MKIYYIRHGDPIYDPDSLTEKGVEQAKATGLFFDSIRLDKIFASTSNRAYLTAKETAVRQNKEIIRLDFADEKYAWKYLSCYDKQKEKNTWIYHIDKFKRYFRNSEVISLGKKWYTHPLFKDFQFKKTFSFFDEEINKWLDSIGIKRNKKTGMFRLKKDHPENVALFAHGGFGTVFMSFILNMPYNVSCLTFKELKTCGIVEFEINENDRFLRCNFYNKTVY